VKLDDILPILVLLIYVGLVFVKHRKNKAGAPKKAVSKGVPKAESQKTAPQKPAANPDRPPANPAVSFDRPAPKLFPLIGERLRRFFSDMEQQFREELEKARTQGPAPESPGYQIFDYQGNPIEPESGEPFTEPGAEPEPDPIPVVHPVAHEPLDKHRRARPRSGCYRDQSRSRQKIRNAVVWSEILEPPLALRQGKRPWEL
jgi:hypothetical protein